MAFAFIAIEPELRLDRLSPLHELDIPMTWPPDPSLGMVTDESGAATIVSPRDLYYVHSRKIGNHVVRVWSVRDFDALPASLWVQIEERVRSENPGLIETIAPFVFEGHEVKASIDNSGGAMVAHGGQARLVTPSWLAVWKGTVYSVAGIALAESEHDIRERIVTHLRIQSAINA